MRPPFAERSGHPPLAELAVLRQAVANGLAAGAWPTDPPSRAIDLDGVRAVVFPPPSRVRGAVLHFHGGGYGIGCPEMMGPYASALAARCSVEVICPAYRLAPDHPFPAAVNDAWCAWTALRRERDGPIVVAGDSAGGGLAASLTALCVAHRERPTGLMLLSPWLDLSVSSTCYDANAGSDPVFSRAQAERSAQAYLQGRDPADPLASPVLGSVAGYPPTFISVGAEEVLDDDSARMYAALSSDAVPVRMARVAGMEHVAVTRGMDRTGARETFAQVADFIDGLLD